MELIAHETYQCTTEWYLQPRLVTRGGARSRAAGTMAWGLGSKAIKNTFKNHQNMSTAQKQLACPVAWVVASSTPACDGWSLLQIQAGHASKGQ